MNVTPYVEFENVSVRFDGRAAIGNMSFRIDNPGLWLIEGPSGSGKTTVLRVIAGLEKNYEGKCLVSGNVSYIFQEPRLFEGFSVLENVTLAVDRRKRGLSKEASEAMCAAILEKLGLGSELSKKAGECSGGMKQRVAAARALAAGPDVLLADEPFSALDEENRNAAAILLAELSSNSIVLVATHGGETAFDESLVTGKIVLGSPGT